MKEKHKITKYPSGNIKTENYIDEDTVVSKYYYDAKDAYVKELIYIKEGITKIKYTTAQGVVSKVEHFEKDKRQGQEIKYFVSKADASIKSNKTYHDGKLHGDNITYNNNGKIIKHEVFVMGKVVLKYLRENSENEDITNIEILDEQSIENLPKKEHTYFTQYKTIRENI